MKILVIGSAGFIGGYCSAYLQKENDVWECDIFPPKDNPKYLRVEKVNTNYFSLFKTQKFDLCINCAGSADVPFSLKNPSIDLQLNTLNVINILEAIRQHNPQCRFMTMSSAAVYGNPPCLPIAENSPINPVSPYGFHKMFAEKVCEEYYRFWEIKTCCLRIFSAYGPGLKKQILWDLYQKFSTKKIVSLWGTGDETRDFIYVSDLIHALDLAVKNSSFQADVINVANGKQHSISQIATIFANEFGEADKTIEFTGTERKGDPIYWEADISKLTSWGYSQQVTIEDGIKKYIQWVRKEHQ